MNNVTRERLIAGFEARLRECITAMGSLYALAKRCEVSIPTLKRYLSGSEPSLTMLVKIAAAANVTVEWLATGEGSKVALADQFVPSDPVASEIRRRFRQMREDLGKPEERLASRTLIPKERLLAIFAGEADATSGELVRLCTETSYSLRWLMTGEGIPRLFRTPVLPERPPLMSRQDSGQLARLQDELSMMADSLQHINFCVHRIIGDAMSPRFNDGDIIIADTSASLERERVGTYLVLDRGHELVAYLSKDGSRVFVSFENEKISPLQREWDEIPVELLVMGRVVYRITMQRQ